MKLAPCAICGRKPRRRKLVEMHWYLCAPCNNAGPDAHSFRSAKILWNHAQNAPQVRSRATREQLAEASKPKETRYGPLPKKEDDTAAIQIGLDADGANLLERCDRKGFKKELETLINKHCIENLCDVPDFLLAEMVCKFIEGIGPCIKQTLDWHGCDSVCHRASE